MFFACKVDGKKYELPKLTLGEARILKRDFGMQQFEDLNFTDPDVLAGLLYLCLRRERPDVPAEVHLAEVEQIDTDTFDAPDDESEAVPTEAAGAADESAGGKPAKTRKKTGSPS